MNRDTSNLDTPDWSISAGDSSQIVSASTEATSSNTSSSNSNLGSGSLIKGSLLFSSPTNLEGRVEGDITCSNELIVSESALVKGTIQSKSLKVFGEVIGDIVAESLLEFFAGARVKGDISCPRIIMHDGVIFEGNCKMEAPSDANSSLSERVGISRYDSSLYDVCLLYTSDAADE